MFGKRLVAVVLAFAFLSLETARAQEATLCLRWAELSAAVANKKVKLVLRNGVHVEGIVESVQSDALSMVVLKSSDRKAHPRGQASIARGELFELRISKIKGPMRLIGAVEVGTAGSFIALHRALDESRPSDDAARMLGWGLTTTASVVGGYFLGRLADRHETLITITFETPPAHAQDDWTVDCGEAPARPDTAGFGDPAVRHLTPFPKTHSSIVGSAPFRQGARED